MGHTYSRILNHVIFATKNRLPTIDESFRQRMYEYLSGVARQEFGRAINIGGTENHLHGLISLRTDVSIAQAMREWKSLSSGWVHETFPGHLDFCWQEGYGSFSVSESKATDVIRYIEHQAEHHRVQTFEEEFVAFLKRHHVEYDPCHIWD